MYLNIIVNKKKNKTKRGKADVSFHSLLNNPSSYSSLKRTTKYVFSNIWVFKIYIPTYTYKAILKKKREKEKTAISLIVFSFKKYMLCPSELNSNLTYPPNSQSTSQCCTYKGTFWQSSISRLSCSSSGMVSFLGFVRDTAKQTANTSLYSCNLHSAPYS